MRYYVKVKPVFTFSLQGSQRVSASSAFPASSMFSAFSAVKSKELSYYGITGENHDY